MVAMLAGLLCAALPASAEGLGVGIGTAYFPGGHKVDITLDVEQQFGTAGDAAFTADVLLLTSGNAAGALCVKPKNQGRIKGGVGYALNEQEPDFSTKNILLTIQWVAYSQAVASSLRGCDPDKEFVIGIVHPPMLTSRKADIGLFGAQYTRRF